MQPGDTRSYGVVSVVLWALVFGLAHTQAPLSYSNQNQYLLHGLAQGGHGFLDEDWLANTADPTPAFSALVAFTHRYLHDSCFHVYYLVLLGLYFYALAGVFTHLTGYKLIDPAGLCFAVLFVAVHAGAARLASTHLLGRDYPWYLQAGVAGQYLLGPVFQPSTFGVLLAVSLYAFLRDQVWLAALCAGLAAALHATYLLGAAFLILGYQVVLVREGRVRTAVGAGLLALALVAPGIVYNLRTFAPSTPETFAQAQHIFVNIRIPHHAVPDRWFDKVAFAQTLWIVLGLALLWGSRLFPVLCLVFGLSLALTLVQIGTGNPMLALLFPWRTSALLMPVATALILARGIQLLAPWLPQGIVLRAVGVLALGLLALSGVAIQSFGLAYPMNKQELPLLEHVREHKWRGDVYLLPVEVPKVGTGPRGSVSVSFTPPPMRGQSGNLIAVDLQRFRLFTGAPIFVDFKSVPYKDVEVIEWWDRLQTAARWYEQADRADVWAEWSRRGITHVVTTARHELDGPGVEQVYADEAYRVYRLRRTGVVP